MNKYATCCILILLFSCSQKSTRDQGRFDPDALFGNKEITVVITDSGLGGLSVMDDIAKKIKTSGCFKKVSLIFVNALFDVNTGYNSLKTREEKIKVFNNVLAGIDKRYHPDIILIACNTLSVIYNETEFVRKTKTPVIGIVESGVKIIHEKLQKDTSSKVIIFGTETTIEEDSHRKALLELNIAKERIVTKACPQLQSYIEQNPSGEETEMLISVYLNEAIEQLPEKSGTVYISLNCSHFGYSSDLWEKALNSTSVKSGGILDPNFIMGDILVEEKYRNRFSVTKISLLVVSKVELLNARSMVNVFQKKSPELANALINYEIIPDLF
jgi:glutamate racemase